MHDPLNGGRSPWPRLSPLDLMLHIERHLGRMDAGQEAMRDEMRAGFDRLERNADHAHARITDLKSEMQHRAASALATPRPSEPETEGWLRGWLTSLTAFLVALGEVLPPLGTLMLLTAWLAVALTAGINAETVRSLIGLGP